MIVHQAPPDNGISPLHSSVVPHTVFILVPETSAACLALKVFQSVEVKYQSESVSAAHNLVFIDVVSSSQEFVQDVLASLVAMVAVKCLFVVHSTILSISKASTALLVGSYTLASISPLPAPACHCCAKISQSLPQGVWLVFLFAM